MKLRLVLATIALLTVIVMAYQARAGSIVLLPDGKRLIFVRDLQDAAELINKMADEIARLEAIAEAKHKEECNLI